MRCNDIGWRSTMHWIMAQCHVSCSEGKGAGSPCIKKTIPGWVSSPGATRYHLPRVPERVVGANGESLQAPIVILCHERITDSVD